MTHNNLKAGLAGAGIFAASIASGYAGYASLAVPAQMGTEFFATLAAKFISNVVAQWIVGGIFAALASALAAVALVSLVNLVMQRMTAVKAPVTAVKAPELVSLATALQSSPVQEYQVVEAVREGEELAARQVTANTAEKVAAPAQAQAPASPRPGM